jgi:hypothetical protein
MGNTLTICLSDADSKGKSGFRSREDGISSLRRNTTAATAQFAYPHEDNKCDIILGYDENDAHDKIERFDFVIKKPHHQGESENSESENLLRAAQLSKDIENVESDSEQSVLAEISNPMASPRSLNSPHRKRYCKRIFRWRMQTPLTTDIVLYSIITLPLPLLLS